MDKITTAFIARVVEDIRLCPTVALGSALDAEPASVVGDFGFDYRFEGETGR